MCHEKSVRWCGGGGACWLPVWAWVASCFLGVAGGYWRVVGEGLFLPPFFVAVGAGRGHVGVLAPSRFCLRVAGVVAIFVGEGRLAWVFLSCFCSRIRVRARACLFVLWGA